MNKKMFLPSISVALYDRALHAANHGQTCNVIMLCTASMEAFINEYIEFCSKLFEQKKKHDEEQKSGAFRLKNKYSTFISPLHPIEIQLMDELKLNEHQRKNIFIKINTIRKHCLGDEWKKDHNIYRDYCTLVKIRNALMHPRSKMVSYGEIDIPKFLVQFTKQKNIDYLNEIDAEHSWVDAIDTRNFSNWCVNAFEKMMILILNDLFSLAPKDYPDIKPITKYYANHYMGSYKFSNDLVKKVLSSANTSPNLNN